MASSKITDLTAATTMASGDLIPIVSDPSGSPATKKITLTNFYSNVVVTAKFANSVTFSNTATFNSSVSANNLFITYRTTPAGSGDSVASGKIWFDTNWLYVATATNVIKRVSLTVF
jgi:hypothetical protein